MASPTVDGSAINSSWAATASATVTLTTTQTNDIILVAVGFEKPTVALSVSSITSTSGLTFTRRSTESSAANNVVTELWQAVSALALTSEVITVNLTGALDAGLIIAAAIHGVGVLSAPNDPDVSLPSVAQATSAAPTVTYSTSAADDLLIATYCSNNSTGTTAPAGWTKLQGALNGGGVSRFCVFALFTKSVSSTQTSQTFTPTANGLNNVAIVDAFTADILVVNVNAPTASSTGAPHATGIEVDVTAPAASSAGVAHDVGVASTGSVSASKAVSPGIARDVSLQIDSNVTAAAAHGTGTPHAIDSTEVAVTAPMASAAGLPHEVTPHAPPFTYLAVETIMRDTAVAAFGAMSNAPVAVIGGIPADGVVPESVAVTAPRASAAGRAIAVGVSRAVRVTAPAASSAGVARNCLAA